MTPESYEKAKEIVREINSVDNEIKELRSLLDRCNLSEWHMEVRPFSSFRSIDHCGMLPEFMQMILEKKLARYKELKEELEEL